MQQIINTTSAQDQEPLRDFNDTIVPYASELKLFEPFEQQVQKSPNAIALQKGMSTKTYDELNRLSNQLANYLIKTGVLPGDNIGLLASRDFDMIVGMLGILKSGGAYVPIDPDYPVDRQQYIYEHSALKLVIVDREYDLITLIGKDKIKIISEVIIDELEDCNPNVLISSKQIAYTIYTSGSTGRPKGVMIEHHSAVNLISWVNNKFNIGSTDRLLFITSMCFDLSVYDIFGMLAAGGTIVIAENSEIQDVRVLQEMLIKYKITFWDSVPTTLDYLVRNLEQDRKGYRYTGLKTIFMSGDWIPVSLPDRISKFFPNSEVVSLGGATEATVWSNYYLVKQTKKEWKSIPYGRPIDNNFFYILNDQLKPVPLGEIGNLYIGGVGVARGYANDPEKTAASFIPDPFNKLCGGVMYRTGDLGKMMPDNNMEFLGREDNQVKINGFRVELGEIENALAEFDGVYNAVVLADEAPDGKKRLVGYVMPNGNFDKELATDFLKTKLPDYMIPAIWIEIEKLPLNSNGKIDRNSFPKPQDASISKNALSPAKTPTEKMLAIIWTDVIGIKECSIDDNFFALGGHSLMAVQILSKIEKQTGMKMQLAVLFKYPNIRSLAAFIDSEKIEIEYKSLVAINPSGTKPPLYIIHGEGLNVLNFSNLADHMDENRPIYGLQAKGLNGIDAPLESIQQIAAFYLTEILHHNPNGPYLIAGYSFGGYVAVEIEKQMAELGKHVQMLIMLDTDAEKTEYKDWYYLFQRKVKRHFPLMLTFIKSTVRHPIETIKRKFGNHPPNFLSNYFLNRENKSFFSLIKKIKEKHLLAFRNYSMKSFNNKVYLFKAEICVHYVDDNLLLGWGKFAKKGVELFEVPGDHLTMLQPPNINQFAATLESVLDANDSVTQSKFNDEELIAI